MRKPTIGLELEQFLLDSKGNIAFESPTALSALSSIRGMPYRKEVGRHMIELGSIPSPSFSTAFRDMTGSLSNGIDVLRKKNLHLFPFGSYPGEFDPEIHDDIWYELKKKILGEDKFKISGLCVGFHCHVAMPQKSFDAHSLFIQASGDHLIDRNMVSAYNLLIAADPALTTFMQSSPAIQGKFLAKDSRMLFYRGGVNLRYDGLYSNFQLFGGLQGYTKTIQGIIRLIEKRYDLWKSALLEHGFDPDLIKRYGQRLDYAWNPVKVNKLGTFEQRGMDANLPTYFAGASLIMHKMLERVYQEHLTVIPNEIGIREPFKIEGNALYVPPANVVLKRLQYLSATEGLESGEIYRNARALYRFILPAVKSSERKYLLRIREMLASRRTMADWLILDLKDEGVWKKGKVAKKEAARIALKWSAMLEEDIEVARRW